MDNSEKKQIAAKLAEYCGRFAGEGNNKGQNRAANSLKGVSAATVSHVLSGDWGLIKDEMWRNIGAQTGYSPDKWQAVETSDYIAIRQILTDAKNDRNAGTGFSITGNAGTGKSFALRMFAQSNKNVYLLTCAEYWNRKQFLVELLGAMGRDCSGLTIAEMMRDVISGLKRQENPLIILDEADKLTDHVLYFFITLYNDLEDYCGIVLCSTNYLEKRIKRGVSLNKKGYAEIESRIGRKCIKLSGISARDIAAVCRANGIEEQSQIREVVDDSEGDLRRVKRKIYAMKRKN